MPFAICLNLDQSKILLSGNGLIFYTRCFPDLRTLRLKDSENIAIH